MKNLIASESVAIGHPDKVADQISDAILDAHLVQDENARVDITTLISHDTLVLAGEITSQASVDVEKIARDVLIDIGYTSKEKGFDATSCKIKKEIVAQSQDIAHAITSSGALGAGDQGYMIGYATDETEELMPLSLVLAKRLTKAIENHPTLGPDGKALVAVVNQNEIPFIVVSYQHTIPLDELRKAALAIIKREIPGITEKTQVLINPGGTFTIGGPRADTGITGRKIIADTYGGASRHGGGAFSGKDPTKVDRSGAYMARYIAKNIVAASIAKRCEVALYYAMGGKYPLTVTVNTFGTATISELEIEKAIPQVFDLSLQGFISHLILQRPIYRKTAQLGHFGTEDPDFTWEKRDKKDDLISFLFA